MTQTYKTYLIITLGLMIGVFALGYFSLSGVFGGTTINLSLSTSDLEVGLVGHWTFDGSDLKENVVDKSGQGNTGYLTNFISTTTIPGKIGQALQFDGTDDYATTSLSETIKTVSLWAKPDSNTDALLELTSAGGGGNWFDSNYSYCRKLTMTAGGDAGGVATTTTAGFALVATGTISSLAATTSGGNIQILDNYIDTSTSTPVDTTVTNGTDCNTDGGAKIDFYFEDYASSTGAFTLWVEPTDISSTSAKTVLLYYGNAGGTDQSNEAGVFGVSNELAVWNLDENPALAGEDGITDSTSNNNDATDTGTSTAMTIDDLVAGQIGNALDFDGDDDYASSTNTIANIQTISFWMKPATTTQNSVINLANGTDWAQVGTELNTSIGTVGLAALNGTDVALLDQTNIELRTYRFATDTPSQVGNGLTIANANSPALAGLNDTDIALVAPKQLRTYRFDGTNWSQVGNSLTIDTNTQAPALAALNGTDVAYIDEVHDDLRLYRFDGTDWTKIGTDLNLGTVTNPALAALNSTDVAFIDDNNDVLRTYRFDGTNWSQIGSELSISSVRPTLTALNSTDVAFIEETSDNLRTYSFDGADWVQVGTDLSILIPSSPALSAFNGTDVAFMDASQDDLRMYRFDAVSIDILNTVVRAKGFTSPTIYTDGVVSSTTDTSWRHVVITTGTAISADNFEIGHKFEGTLDDVRLYSQALHSMDIKTIYNNTVDSATFWTYGSEETETTAGGGFIELSSGVVGTSGFTSPVLYVNGRASSTITANEWTHIVITDSTGASIDGVDIGRVSTTYFDGAIDDLRVYNRQLSEREAKKLFELGGTAKINTTITTEDLAAGLVGHWTFDGPDLKENVVDRSGQGNTGYLTNFTSTTTIISKIGQALQFDGIDDYASSTNTISNVQTVSFWMKPATTTQSSIINLANGSTWSQVGNDLNIVGSGFLDLATLNNTDIAFFDSSQDDLRTYRFNGSTWSQVGSDLHITGASDPALTALNGTDVAFIDATNSKLATYRFDGSTWSEVGASTSISSIGIPALAALNSTDVAFIDQTNKNLATYRFNGSTWSEVGASTSIASTLIPALTALNSTDVAFIDSTNDDLRTYRFDGSTWSQVGSDLFIVGAGTAVLTTLNSTDVALIDHTNDDLRTYRFDAMSIDSLNTVVRAKGFTTPTIYTDGIVSSTTDTSWRHVVITTGTAITANNFEIGHKFEGILDDVRIYNRALSEKEAKQLYELGGTTHINTTVNTEDLSSASGLVGHWTFDGPDLKENVVDRSEGGNTGYLTNFTSTTTAIGKIGQALEFDGTDDYVDAGNIGTGLKTIAFWIKPDDVTTRDVIDIDGTDLIEINNNGDLSATSFPASTVYIDGTTPTSTSLTAGSWYHITVTDTTGVNGSAFQIGREASDATNEFDGVIDDVRVYNRVLSPAEVTRLYGLGR